VNTVTTSFNNITGKWPKCHSEQNRSVLQ